MKRRILFVMLFLALPPLAWLAIYNDLAALTVPWMRLPDPPVSISHIDKAACGMVLVEAVDGEKWVYEDRPPTWRKYEFKEDDNFSLKQDAYFESYFTPPPLLRKTVDFKASTTSPHFEVICYSVVAQTEDGGIYLWWHGLWAHETLDYKLMDWRDVAWLWLGVIYILRNTWINRRVQQEIKN